MKTKIAALAAVAAVMAAGTPVLAQGQSNDKGKSTYAPGQQDGAAKLYAPGQKQKANPGTLAKQYAPGKQGRETPPTRATGKVK